MKLSPTMTEVLGKMRAAGGRIERWPGGFWTTPGQPFTTRDGGGGLYKVPAWWTATGTVRALADRGLIVPDAEQTNRAGSFVVGYRLVD